MEKTRPRKLAVILHADVVGSTILVQRNESLAHVRIQDTFHRFSLSIEAYGGVTHEIRGDALVAEFARASDAVSAGLAFQIENAGTNALFEDDLQPELRIGISLGEVVIGDNTLTGAGVVLAQRIEQLAEPGGVCITEAVHEAVPQHLPLQYSDLGKQELKGFEKPVQVYRAQVKAQMRVSPPDPAESLARRSHTPKHLWTASFFALLFLVIVGLAWLRPWKVESDSDLSARPSIAVLPFTNMNKESDQQYFADGMTDDLITDLSKISGLSVVARNSVFTYKDRVVRLEEVAKELGVRYVLEGSVRRAGGRVRINVQLTDASSGQHLWAERYDRDHVDIFSVQNDVIGRITSELAVRLTDLEERQVKKLPTANLEAYDYYLRARQEGFSPEEELVHKAIVFYRKAIELDPQFADAYAGYARANVEVWRFGYNALVAGAVAQKRAYEAASRALALDSDNALAYSVLAMLQVVDGRHEEAMASADKAVQLHPNDAAIHVDLGLVLAYSGRTEQAVRAVNKALELDPNPSPDTRLFAGIVFYSARQYDRAIGALESARGKLTRNETPATYLSAAYGQSGKLELARREIDRLREFLPIANLNHQRLTYAYYKRPGDLEHFLDGLRRAGLPEWPLGLGGPKEVALDSETVRDVTLGKTWTGRHVATGLAFVQEISAAGALAYRSTKTFVTGEAWLKDNLVCQRFEGYLSGRPLCGHIYSNRSGTPETQDEYLYVNPDTARYFSVMK